MLKQIDAVASDSSYKGINLLGGTTNKLSVKFSEKTGSTSKLDITGVDASTKGGASSLNIADAADWDKVADNIATLQGAVTTKKADYEAAPNDSGAKAAYENAVAALEAQQAADLAAQNTAIANSISAVEAAITKLRTWSSEFGNNYSIVQSREEFTENLINVLTEGADKLTLADMNEESANMLALQTRQQLAVNSLSLASQASQSVLRLF
ncbi:MAG: hypothetical protein E7012_07120 [Alphaproteobacteria bacterium]|nr:hypothetical protein [Alphaproteobacteria bacterium]